MSTNKIAVVFDTNSYRNFVLNKSTEETLKAIAELIELEKRKDIQAYGIQVVGLEMLANLSEGVNGINFKDCKNGIIAMANHCFNDKKNEPRITPQPYLHLSHSLFNTIPEEIEHKSKNIGGVIRDFKLAYNKAIDYHSDNSTYVNVKSYLNKKEKEFSKNIVDLIDSARQLIITKYPKIASKQLRSKLLEYIKNGPYENSIALAIVIITASSLQIRLSNNEIENRARVLHTVFPLSVGFFKWISYKIVNNNINMQSNRSQTRRWNWIWDYQVSFLISDSTLDYKDVILVTNDLDITEMIHNSGFSNRVFNIKQYLKFLNS